MPDKGGFMDDQPEVPFESIEGALEYVSLLLEAIQEAQQHVETEIALAADPQLARRKQALQLVRYKLDRLSVNIAGSHRILNDLRTLRRLLLEERQPSREAPEPSVEPEPLPGRLGE
jgi:hypothetical protein